MGRPITDAMVRRSGQYLSYLKKLPDEDHRKVSAAHIAAALQLNEVLVRKDLACSTGPGSPKVGRNKEEMIDKLEQFLGLAEPIKVVYVGDGAFLEGIRRCSNGYLEILDLFTPDEKMDSMSKPLSALADLCYHDIVEVAILDVPAAILHQTVDQVVDCGIRTIWNFSSIPLEPIANVKIKNESMLASLSILFHSAK